MRLLGTLPSRPPVLVPVLGSFVRRHVEGRWPEHAEWCDFFRDAAAQAAVNASYRDDTATGLVRAFADGAAAPRQVVTRSGSEHRRSRLARMLFKLLDRSGLASFQYGQRRSLSDQYGALRRAAELVPLEGDLPVSSSLCTYPPRLSEFLGRVGRMQPGRFQRSGNPHGLLIGVARSAAGGVIEPTQGEPIAVAGEISIFGERDGRDDGPGLAAARGPYLMICLVGRRMREADVEVLRAYLHPCLSESWLFPVDSDLERQTMAKLVEVGRRILAERELPLSVSKPLFDLAEPPEAAPGGQPEAHEPILPDFIVQAGEGATARRVVVETMGYANAAYRARKLRLRPEMERLGGGPVIEHDFHLPAGWSQRQRDHAFTTALFEALTAERPG